MSERIRILKMVEDGVITAEEAEQLLKSLDEDSENKNDNQEAVEGEYADSKQKLESAKEKLKKAYKKVEEAELKASKKITDSKTWEKVKTELNNFKDEIDKGIKAIDKKLNDIGDKTVKENINDLSKKIDNFGEKMKGWFK